MPNLQLVNEPADRLLRALRALRNGDFSARLAADRGAHAELVGAFNELADFVQAFAGELTRAQEELSREGQADRRIRIAGAAGGWLQAVEAINSLLDHSVLAAQNVEKEWLKGNLAKFVRMLQAERDLAGMARRILSELAPLLDAQQGVLYVQRGHGDDARLELFASYALGPGQNLPATLKPGETLVGQCAQEKKRILLNDVPRAVFGSTSPLNVIIVPALYEGSVKAVIELASLRPFGETQLVFLEQLAESIGTALHALETESLLRKRQEELQRKNEELQDKAEQLALASRYQSEFLANMSHELRTPLNSLLILARLLVDNPDGTLGPKPLEYVRTIHAAGTDLLALINEILDLAKVESGTVVLDVDTVAISALLEDAERAFRQVALDKRLRFEVASDPALPPTIRTDGRRLQQVLKNLLSNAFKFTDSGSVVLRVERVRSGWTPGHAELDRATGVAAFVVEDTGSGIAEEKRRLIFQAFRQSGASTEDREGTGLGLSICLRLTRLLQGEIRVESLKGAGSRFTVYLPFSSAAPAQRRAAPADPLLAPRRAAPQPALAGLAGRKVLIIDDDIRNVFALTGALEEHGIRVLDAESGAAGLESLKREPDVDAVLMDMMMPGLDGFDSIRMIRSQRQFRDLPIIAVTARAMKGDREKCIEAGATDYISKPVDVGQLLHQLQGCLAK